MKKLLILITLLLVLAFPTHTHAADKISQASATLVQSNPGADPILNDMRVKALENVFKKHNSPLATEAVNYVKYADLYGVDWKLLPAISGLESSFGLRLMPGSYNAYGWGGGHIYFDSWEDGIKTINKSLRERYMDRGAIDVWSIGPIYAESPTWAVRVNRFMSEINAEYLKLTTFTLAPTI